MILSLKNAQALSTVLGDFHFGAEKACSCLLCASPGNLRAAAQEIRSRMTTAEKNALTQLARLLFHVTLKWSL